MIDESRKRYDSRKFVRWLETNDEENSPWWINAGQAVADVERTHEGGYPRFLAEGQNPNGDPEVTYNINPKNRDLLLGSDRSLWKRA